MGYARGSRTLGIFFVRPFDHDLVVLDRETGLAKLLVVYFTKLIRSIND